MLQFDPNGYLIPPEIIETTLADFEKTFSNNYHRSMLFQGYLDFILELKRWQPKKFVQWVNGSFTTTNPQPNDIDIVTFLPFDLKFMQDEFYVGVKKNFRRRGLDCHFVPVYPETHPMFFRFEQDKIQWFLTFSSDRNGTEKGLIQLNF